MMISLIFLFFFIFLLIFAYKHFKSIEKFIDFYILRRKKCFIRKEEYPINKNELEECILISKLETTNNKNQYLIKKYSNYYSKYFVVNEEEIFF